MQNIEEKVKQRIISDTDAALDVIEDYLLNKGKGRFTPELVRSAFLLLGQSTKIMQMNQSKALTERSQALRFLPYLRDDKVREEYIKLTNPQLAQLPLKRVSESTGQAQGTQLIKKEG